MDSDAHIARASDLAEAVHDYGAKICMQLSAGLGRQEVNPTLEKRPVAPSAIPCYVDPKVICHKLTKAEIKDIVKEYAKAARRIVTAGFDMIEVHGHTGYLIDQFMTPLWNKRADEYGGDMNKRMRFPLELISSVRDVVGSDFPLSFRLSADHKIPNGRTLSEALEIARLLESAGIDVLHIDGGCYDSMPWIFPPSYYPEVPMVELAAAVKKLVKIPVITVGKISRPEFAEQILKDGRADFIAIGRQLIADPEWANKAKDGRVEEIRPCIACNEFCIGRVFYARPLGCSVNAAAGKESYYALERPERQKRIMIVGGGPAGMEAARVAALRGHSVTLYEKEKTLGGQVKAASKPAFKVQLQRLVNYLSFQLRKVGVKVEIGKEVTPHLVDVTKPDVVVIATGATPLVCRIPGNENTINVIDLHLGNMKLGSRVIVAGGGVTGCDTALHLAQEGKRVTIIEMLPAIAGDLNPISRQALLEELSQTGVKILTNHTIKKFKAQGLIAAGKDGKEKTIKADNIICALGSQSENKLMKSIEGKVREVHAIGDCVEPRKVGEAIHDGFVAGWKI
jgi:2,4-dienoyl-CoA reductase-like NADH-dependent reductase (Old Yellow Enzyme family)/pyruvate/2-oxoglutarate dehydrogenase complex dihydrolipoamide dehydrogenase (E3) component